MTLRKLRLTWKYRKFMWKYRRLLRHRREIAGVMLGSAALAAGIFLTRQRIES
ncbi:MAG: hypothetical protein LAQ69_15400 [Acidobacteriia bacterium]|nr:hypothetical protein [Terriglobia bacterium]